MAKKLTREFMLSKIMAYDMLSIMDDVDKGDLSYLWCWLTGEGLTQYKDLSDDDVRAEWHDGCYDGDVKQEDMERSRHFDHPFIQNLLKNGTDEGTWDGHGNFTALEDGR